MFNKFTWETKAVSLSWFHRDSRRCAHPKDTTEDKSNSKDGHESLIIALSYSTWWSWNCFFFLFRAMFLCWWRYEIFLMAKQKKNEKLKKKMLYKLRSFKVKKLVSKLMCKRRKILASRRSIRYLRISFLNSYLRFYLSFLMREKMKNKKII